MSRGGKRPNAGRKKGSKDQSTIEKERVLAEYRNKIMKHADILFRNQMHLAQGVSYLYKWVKGKQKPVLVEDPKEIEQYVLTEMGKTIKKDDKIDKDATYYFISTERPDNRAIDSMLDRTFGKASQSMDLTSKGKQIKGVAIDVQE